MDPKISHRKLKNTPSKKMVSSFSFYGGSQTSPNWAKMANIKTINPGEAANKFYDKNITRALDKFTS